MGCRSRARDDDAAPVASRGGRLPARAAWPTLDRVIDAAIAEKAFPGGVRRGRARDGALVHLRAFGRLSYDADAAAVTDRHDLRPGQPDQGRRHHHHGHDAGGRGPARPRQARARVPAAASAAEPRTRVTVRQLLTHSSGIDWWAPLYKEHRGPGRPTSSASRRWTWRTSRARSRSTATWGSCCWARSWSAWRASRSTPSRAAGSSGPLGMKDTQLPRRRRRCVAAHRADRERPLARAGRARRGARRERVRDRRRRAARGPLRHRARPGAVRADAAERRRLRPPALRLARDASRRSRGPRACRARRARSAGTRRTARTPPARSCRRARSGTRASRARRCGSTPSAGCS